MHSCVRRVPLARTVALTAGLCAVSAAAFTGTGLAAVPGGTACNPTDGKITGRGATFQTKAMAALIAGYKDDVCGAVTADTASGTNMLVYNLTGAPNGSGQGLEATRCRTDAFGGTDIPYDQQDLALMNGPLLSSCQSNTYAPPAGYGPGVGPFPHATDVAPKTVMSYPIAGSAASIIVRLDAGAGCPSRVANGPINLSKAAMSGLSGGDILTWGDSRITADNPTLAGCTTPVTRIVRFDKSGTTQIMKNYLKNADGARAGATCDPGTSWTTLALDANNASWPGAVQTTSGTPPVTTSTPTAATATCSALDNGGANGNGPMVTKTRNTNGGFSYPDLADGIAAGTPAVVLAGLRNATDTAFVKPNKAVTNAANCDFATSPPGSTDNDSVGLNTGGDNWGTDSTTNHSDTTFKGALWPICALTFDLVYTGNSVAAPGGPISGLTDNQRRTLFSFMQYALTPVAQDRLSAPATFYAPVPSAIISKVRKGFKANF